MQILRYNPELTKIARHLRSTMTVAELRLWQRLRRRQLHAVQFYRQRPIGRFVVDFYAPKGNLVVELDGSQHFESAAIAADVARDNYLKSHGLRVLRFDNLQVLREIEGVIESISRALLNCTDAK